MTKTEEIKNWLKGKKEYKIEILYTTERFNDGGTLQTTTTIVNGKKTNRLPKGLEKSIVQDYIFRKL